MTMIHMVLFLMQREFIHYRSNLIVVLKDMFHSLHKLEAVGLVQTFLADNVFNNIIVFKLLQVPSADKFFATPLLASLLKEKSWQPNLS